MVTKFSKLNGRLLFKSSGKQFQVLKMVAAVKEASLFLSSASSKPEKVRRSFPSWLGLFFGKESNNDDLNSIANVLSATAMIEKPVLTVKQAAVKGILKPAKRLDETIEVPPPIKKSAFLRTEEILRLTAPQTSSEVEEEENEYAMDIDEDPMKQKKGRRLQWAEQECQVEETWSPCEYIRGGNDYIAKHLNPVIAMAIKRELNELKSEMEVHEESVHHTQFYAVK